MEITQKLVIILIAGVFTDNFILSKFLGVCPFLGVSKSFSNSLGMGLTVLLTMVFATMLTYPVYMFILVPLKIEYMNIIAFVLIIALFVQVVEMFMKKKTPKLHESLGVFLPLTTTNCAVLGVTLLSVGGDYNFGYAVFNAFCAGLGFLIVLLLFSSIREKVEQSDVPNTLKGAPITLIAAAITSLAFIGFR